MLQMNAVSVDLPSIPVVRDYLVAVVTGLRSPPIEPPGPRRPR